jgi:hypothetical protein
MHKRLFIGIIIAVCLSLSIPVVAAEFNLGGGYPLWGTHTDDDNNHFDGGWIGFASIDKRVEARKWLRYGLMYNYARIKMGVEETYLETHEWLTIHVLGPYAKPTWQMTERLKAFVTIGAGAMYVDGPIYGDELGIAGSVSAGFGLDITKHLGLSAQMLYVQGYTKHVEDIDYMVPVVTISYRW